MRLVEEIAERGIVVTEIPATGGPDDIAAIPEAELQTSGSRMVAVV